MDEKKIPLTIGITGHLDVRSRDTALLREAVKRELTGIRARCPHTPAVMLCALARGADLLCAEAAEELGIPLRAVLPMGQAEYEKDFGPEDRLRLHRQLDRAEAVIEAPGLEAEEENSRDACYRRAGIYIAEHSHLLLALWDGKSENQSACGTAAVVDAALRGAWKPLRGMACRRAENLAVIQVVTPREESGDPDAGKVIFMGGRETAEETLARTEEFNRLAETAPEGEETPLPEAEGADPTMRKLAAVMGAADGLSLRFARQYRRIIGALAVLGTAVALTFLLYDEINLIWMILICGAALLLAMAAAGRAKRTAGHRRYIEYRMLAEALRVQMFLRYAGSRIETQRIMTWSEQQETPWILCAMCALNAGGSPPEKTRDIRECWVEKQRIYHAQAEKRTKGKSARNDRLLRLAGICTVTLYFGGVLFELLCGGLTPHPVLPVRNADVWRTVLKVLLGTVSVGTLFLASYYGKMSLERKKADHGKMEAFFRTVGAQMDRFGQTEELMELLAREELTENGNWSSYQRDNAPELNI